MCLLSMESDTNRRLQIKRLGLNKYFILIKIISGNKSENDFRDCINKMNLKASEITVIGDRVEGEIRLGNIFGMTTVWFKKGIFSKRKPMNDEETPDHTIVDLNEIINLVQQ